MTGPTPKMSLERRIQRLEDIEEIKRLRALYCFYNDGGWPEHGPSHPGPCADLYTEDAEWDGRPFMPLMEGRSALQKGIDEAARMSFVMHHVMNPIIDVEGDEAKGQWHMFACTKLPDHTSHWQLGYYFEEYRRTPEGWRIRKTRFVTARVFPELTSWSRRPLRRNRRHPHAGTRQESPLHAHPARRRTRLMPAYVIAAVQIGPEAEDHANYVRYAELGGAAVAKFGAELLAMEDAPTLIEGNLPASRILLLRFNDVAHAQQWYDSPDYQQAIPYRQQASETRFILAVNGLAPGQ